MDNDDLASEEFSVYQTIPRFANFRGMAVTNFNYGPSSNQDSAAVTDTKEFNKIMLIQKYIALILSPLKVENTPNTSTNILILIINEKNTLTDSFFNMLRKLPKMNIIVISNSMKPQLREKFLTFLDTNTTKMYDYDHFVFPWIDHVNVPKFEVAKKEEIQNLTEEARIAIKGLPGVLDNQLMCIWSGAEIGDVLKIYDRNETSNFHYRLVSWETITKI